MVKMEDHLRVEHQRRSPSQKPTVILSELRGGKKMKIMKLNIWNVVSLKTPVDYMPLLKIQEIVKKILVKMTLSVLINLMLICPRFSALPETIQLWKPVRRNLYLKLH